MLKTQAERVDERVQNSKYFRKHYEVDTPHLFDFTCPDPYCGGIFTADYRWFKYVRVKDQAREFAEIHCPYCGKIFRRCV